MRAGTPPAPALDARIDARKMWPYMVTSYIVTTLAENSDGRAGWHTHRACAHVRAHTWAIWFLTALLEVELFVKFFVEGFCIFP